MSETSGKTPLVVGTAGHIDHGKSSLIKALTGTDPDRLLEEQRRGITIEPGFAQLVLPDQTSMGVVDVPGHERFVRQMIAGASGIDIALLCIAADDGIMPQTVEHRAVLELLGIPRCIVVLTKSDLVDDEWKNFVTGEISTFLADSPYHDAPIVAVSSKTGQGLELLKTTLMEMARKTDSTDSTRAVRLPVDRVFTIKGSGTVITGTLWQGTITLDDELEILPRRKRVRVRDIQTHGVSRPTITRGNRVALNLSNAKTDEVHVGDFLVTPDSTQTTDRFDAHFTYLDTGKTGKPLVSGTRIRLAHGTKEVLGRILFMDERATIKPHESGYVQFRLDEPLAVARNDRFIVRSNSPIRVIGGGSVLIAAPKRRTKLSLQERALLDALMQNDESALCGAALDTRPEPIRPSDLVPLTGCTEKVLESYMKARVEQGSLRMLSRDGIDYFAPLHVVQKYTSIIENNLLGFHAKNPLSAGIQKAALLKLCRFPIDQTCFDALLSLMEDKGTLVVSNGEVSHLKAGAGAKKLEQKAQEVLGAALENAKTTPPTIDELITQTGIDSSVAFRALNALEKEGKVRRIGNEFYFSSEAMEMLRSSVTRYLEKAGEATAAELKDAMGVSRKYAIPLLEAFDADGLTIRSDTMRRLHRA